MITLFDVGDEIEVTLKGIIKQYEISEKGDCYTIVLLDDNHIYLDSAALKNAVKV